jgi:hypothetical protein
MFAHLAVYNKPYCPNNAPYTDASMLTCCWTPAAAAASVLGTSGVDHPMKQESNSNHLHTH